MKMLQKFYIPARVIEAANLYADDAYNATFEIASKNGKLYIIGTNRANLLCVDIGRFADAQKCGYTNQISGNFYLRISRSDLFQYTEKSCSNFSGKARMLVIIGLEIVENDQGNVYARMFVPDINVDEQISYDLEYKTELENSYFSCIGKVVEQNDPKCTEASHLPFECLKMTKKALKLLTGKTIDPIFKENGWGKPALLENECFIIMIMSFRKSSAKGHYSAEPGEWANI